MNDEIIIEKLDDDTMMSVEGGGDVGTAWMSWLTDIAG